MITDTSTDRSAQRHRAVAFLGGGSQGGSIASTFRRALERGLDVPDVVGVFDDRDEHDALFVHLGIPHLGPIQGGRPTRHAHGMITIGDGRTRLALVDHLERLTLGASDPFVHDSVPLGHMTTIGPGTIVFGNTWVAPGTTIGSHVLVLASVNIGHGATIDDCAVLAPFAAISGEVVVGRGANIGTHAAILPGVRIGERAVVGAGAIVHRDVPDDTVVVGVPARPIDR